MKVDVRKATEKDIKYIVNFVKKLTIEDAKYDPKICINYDKAEQAKTKKYYKKIIETNFGLTIVAEIDEKVVGYLNSYVIEKNNVFADNVALLNGFYVIDEYLENGVEKALTKEFEKWCKDCQIKYLKARIYSTNEKMIKIYNELGFYNLVLEMEKKI